MKLDYTIIDAIQKFIKKQLKKSDTRTLTKLASDIKISASMLSSWRTYWQDYNDDKKKFDDEQLGKKFISEDDVYARLYNYISPYLPENNPYYYPKSKLVKTFEDYNRSKSLPKIFILSEDKYNELKSSPPKNVDTLKLFEQIVVFYNQKIHNKNYSEIYKELGDLITNLIEENTVVDIVYELPNVFNHIINFYQTNIELHPDREVRLNFIEEVFKPVFDLPGELNNKMKAERINIEYKSKEKRLEWISKELLAVQDKYYPTFNINE